MTNFDEYPRPMTNFFLAIAAYQLPRYKSLMPPRQSLDYPFGGWENGGGGEGEEGSTPDLVGSGPSTPSIIPRQSRRETPDSPHLGIAVARAPRRRREKGNEDF